MTKASPLSATDVQTYMADMCSDLAELARTHDMPEAARYLTLAQRLIALEIRENVAPTTDCASAA